MCHSFLPSFIQELIFTFIQDWYTICFNTNISVNLIDLCTDILQHIPKIVSTDRYMLYSPQMPHLVFNGVPYHRGVIWPSIFFKLLKGHSIFHRCPSCLFCCFCYSRCIFFYETFPLKYNFFRFSKIEDAPLLDTTMKSKIHIIDNFLTGHQC